MGNAIDYLHEVGYVQYACIHVYLQYTQFAGFKVGSSGWYVGHTQY